MSNQTIPLRWLDRGASCSQLFVGLVRLADVRKTDIARGTFWFGHSEHVFFHEVEFAPRDDAMRAVEAALGLAPLAVGPSASDTMPPLPNGYEWRQSGMRLFSHGERIGGVIATPPSGGVTVAWRSAESRHVNHLAEGNRWLADLAWAEAMRPRPAPTD